MMSAQQFLCSYSPNLPELLSRLECSIAVSTYQADKVIIISAKDNNIVQLPRTFKNATAIGLADDRLAIATLDAVIILKNSTGLAPKYPLQPDTYESLFLPSATYYTGQLNIHGLSWGKEGLWAVNTAFSCLSIIDYNYSFTPKWRPSFITDLYHEDRCHLNGMVMKNGEPLFVTALGSGNSHRSWKEKITKGGVIIHVPSNQILATDLPIPHSPGLYNDKLYMLLSATGEIIIFDMDRCKYDVIYQLSGFLRGMSIYGDYMFVGQSMIRDTAPAFKDLPVGKGVETSGFSVLHIPTGKLVAELKYHNTVQEISDIEVLPGLRRPGILNTEKETHTMALVTPDASFWAVKKE